MERSRLERWIQRIYDTEEEEISCTQCFEAISQYVDLELSGEAVEAILPRVKGHLNQCQVCFEEYELLRDLARQVAEDPTHPAEDLQE